MRVIAKFVTSATEVRQFPDASAPEVAFLGRSNVGKSSLLNSLVGEKIARTSSTPGRTRMINFFEIRRPGKPGPELLFADLPGYGYAKASRAEISEWPKFIEPYLHERAPLALCISLIDAHVPPQENDKQMIEWLRQSGRPFVTIATKADRLSGNELRNSLRRLEEAHGIEHLLPYSARTGAGRDDLWRHIWEKVAHLRP
ncbi:MAG TPA: ribosome biogenesis GTP-binding protein YihA/YsxC [Terriglobales bacterium]|nr:ribosome biogenesis GTP-binding protein YihA/YsxC [Terriglobales bacterium]